MNEREDFSKYGKSFQENLCHLILTDRPFADQMSEVLDTSFLELKYLQIFVKKIFDYRSKFGVHPTVSIMKTVLRTELSEVSESNKVSIRNYFVRILADPQIESSEYIKETSLNFWLRDFSI